MAEVADHLVPTDGLTNSSLSFEGFDLAGGGDCDCRFRILDEKKNYVATFSVRVSAQNQSADHMLAEAHRKMCDVLRQWLYGMDMMRQVYSKRADGYNPPQTS